MVVGLNWDHWITRGGWIGWSVCRFPSFPCQSKERHSDAGADFRARSELSTSREHPYAGSRLLTIHHQHSFSPSHTRLRALLPGVGGVGGWTWEDSLYLSSPSLPPPPSHTDNKGCFTFVMGTCEAFGHCFSLPAESWHLTASPTFSSLLIQNGHPMTSPPRLSALFLPTCSCCPPACSP